MAMALNSFRASPRSVLFGDERACSTSSRPTSVHLSSLRSSIRPEYLRFQRTFCDSWRWSSPDGTQRRPGTAFANATAIKASALNFENVLPPSALSVAPILLAALVPVVISIYLSKLLNLGLKNEIQECVFRATTQLSLLGFALKLVFEGQNIALSVMFMMVMVIVAGQTSGERAKLVPRSKLISTLALLGGAFSTLWLMVLLRVFPLEARYIIPGTASLVGSSMTVVAITLNCLQHEIYLNKSQIEAALALGATPQHAITDYIRQSLVRGLGPILDHMKVSGLVTLPGAMTGMLISGSQPLEALKTSLVLLYMLLGACSLSAVIGAQLGWRTLFSNSSQLLEAP